MGHAPTGFVVCKRSGRRAWSVLFLTSSRRALPCLAFPRRTSTGIRLASSLWWPCGLRWRDNRRAQSSNPAATSAKIGHSGGLSSRIQARSYPREPNFSGGEGAPFLPSTDCTTPTGVRREAGIPRTTPGEVFRVSPLSIPQRGLFPRASLPSRGVCRSPG